MKLKFPVNKTAQIGFGSVFAISLGIVFSKALANYFPHEYFGYFGLIKAYSNTIMNMLLLGINYSYFFMHRENVDNGKMDNHAFMGKSFSYIGINIAIMAIGLLLVYLITNINKLILLSFCVAVNIALTKIYAQNDAVNGRFYRYFIYLGAQSILFLLATLCAFLIELDLLISLLGVSVVTAFVQAVFIYSFFLQNRVMGIARGLSRFYKDNFAYSKYFFGHVFLTSVIVSYIQLGAKQGSACFLSEFNACIQLCAFMTIISQVFGTYLFPKLVKDSKDGEQHTIFYFVFISVALSSILILALFDPVVSILYKKNFIELNVIFFLVLNAKGLEIMMAPLSARFQAELKFWYLYSVAIGSAMPLLIYTGIISWGTAAFAPSIFAAMYFLYYFIQFVFHSYNNRQSVLRFSLVIASYAIYFIMTKIMFIG